LKQWKSAPTANLLLSGAKSLKKLHEILCDDCEPIKTTYFIAVFAFVQYVLSHLLSFNSVAGICLVAAVMSLSFFCGVSPFVQLDLNSSRYRVTYFFWTMVYWLLLLALVSFFFSISCISVTQINSFIEE